MGEKDTFMLQCVTGSRTTDSPLCKRFKLDSVPPTLDTARHGAKN